MTKRTRNILFLFFVLLFFIITPLASLYTAGYKINLGWPPRLSTALQKTGMFVIETEPEGARVFIDEESPRTLLKKLLNQDEIITTPAKIKNLLPGKYDIRIELDGYWSWQKELGIYPGQTTQIKNILLFKKDLPIKITGAKTENIQISPNKQYLAFVENSQAVILNLKNENKNIFKINENYSNKNYIAWSSDSKAVIINNILINTESNLYSDLSKVIGSKIHNVKWSKSDNSKIFYQHLDAINLFDIKSMANTKIFEKEECLDYTQENGYLVAIFQNGSSTKIRKISIRESSVEKELDFPYSSDYKLLDTHNSLVHLYDEKLEILYLINLDSYFNHVEEVISNIKDYYWVNQDTLLYYNDFEIWLYYKNSKNKDLLTRISDKIIDAKWHPSGKYILYSTNKNLNILELDKRERRNITKLLEIEKINSPEMDNEGEIIYFQAKIGNQEGIYKLEI